MIAQLVFFSCATLGQNLEAKIGGIIHNLDYLFEKELNTINLSDSSQFKDSTVIMQLSQIVVERKDSVSENYYFEAEQEALRKHTSLAFKAGFLQNFNASQVDFDDNILYQRRYRSQLEWNILNNGFFEDRAQIKTLELEKKLYKAKQKYMYDRTDFPSKMNHAIYVFNFHKNQLLKQRSTLLNKAKKYLEELYFYKKVPKESMLDLYSKLAEVKALKEIYGVYNSFNFGMDTTLLYKDLGLFDINYHVFATFDDNNLDTLKQDMLAALEKQNQWFRQIGIKTFIRHSTYDLVTLDPKFRDFFSAGFGITIPLSFNRKETYEADRQKLLKRFNDINKAKLNKEIDVLNEAYEYRYHLKQYVMFYQKKQLVLERIRQEVVKEKFLDADYNPLHALDLIDRLYQIEVELLDIQQNLYIRLLKIHEKLRNVPMEDLIVPFTVPNINEPATTFYRTVYIWSEALKQYSIPFLLEYIRYSRFDAVELAIGKDSDSLTRAKIMLVDALFRYNIDVNLMLGQNKLLFENNPGSYIKDCIKPYPLSKINAIDLDVEPHVLDNWDKERNKLQNNFLKVLKATQSICQDYDMELTVNLPLTLDDSSYISTIVKHVDEVRLMCYENIKRSYLERKIKAYHIPPGKVSISLRTEDFDSRSLMEDFGNSLGEELNIFKLNFHDLSRLIQIDRTVIDTNEKH